MNRFTIYASVEIDIEADDDSDAFAAFADALNDIKGSRDAIVLSSSTVERPYRGAPKGAERWSVAARRIRLGEESTFDEPVDIAVRHDGSWWWSNGHVMLRCEGEAPATMRVLPAEDGQKAFRLDVERRPTKWSRPLRQETGNLSGRRSSVDTALAIQDRYYELVSRSLGAGGARWLAGAEREPIHVHDIDGRLMAVVMPMNAEGLEADPSAPSAAVAVAS